MPRNNLKTLTKRDLLSKKPSKKLKLIKQLRKLVLKSSLTKLTKLKREQ